MLKLYTYAIESLPIKGIQFECRNNKKNELALSLHPWVLESTALQFHNFRRLQILITSITLIVCMRQRSAFLLQIVFKFGFLCILITTSTFHLIALLSFICVFSIFSISSIIIAIIQRIHKENPCKIIIFHWEFCWSIWKFVL